MAVTILSKVGARFAAKDAEHASFALLNIARERWGRRSSCIAASIPYQAIFFVVDGSGSFATRGREVRVGKGHVFCCGPGVGHEISCKGDDELDLLVLRFRGHAARQMMIESMGDTNLVCKTGNPLAVQRLLEQVLDLAQAQPPLYEEICNQYLPLLLVTIKSGLVPAEKLASKAYGSFDACRRYIDQHFGEFDSTQTAAHACQLEHAYMCRLFRRFLGTSPHDYWLRLRMNHAAHLLQTSSESVKAIARAAHFADAHAFSKSFKRLFGVTPDRYRTNLARKGSENGV